MIRILSMLSDAYLCSVPDPCFMVPVCELHASPCCQLQGSPVDGVMSCAMRFRQNLAPLFLAMYISL